MPPPGVFGIRSPNERIPYMPGAPRKPHPQSRRMVSLRLLGDTIDRLEDTARDLRLNKTTVLELAIHHLADALNQTGSGPVAEDLKFKGRMIENAGRARRPPLPGIFGKPRHQTPPPKGRLVMIEGKTLNKLCDTLNAEALNLNQNGMDPLEALMRVASNHDLKQISSLTDEDGTLAGCILFETPDGTRLNLWVDATESGITVGGIGFDDYTEWYDDK